MVIVETYLDKSPINGIGLFAKKPISKGTIIWQWNGLIDKVFDRTRYNYLESKAKEFVDKYGYVERGRIVLCGDDGRFMNHSKTPNTYETEDFTIALHDISIGMEITCDYSTFDESFVEFNT